MSGGQAYHNPQVVQNFNRCNFNWAVVHRATGVEVNDASGVAQLSETGWAIDELAFARDGGTGTGTLAWTNANGEAPDQLELDLHLTNIELGLLEACLLDDARNMSGRLDGT